MTHKEVVDSLLKAGATLTKDVKVIGVKVAGMDTYVRVSLTLNKEVEGYVANEDGTYSPGKTNVIFVSLYSITAVLKNSEEAAFAVNHILEHTKSIEVFLSHATIDVLQEHVKEGTDYVNPWSTKEDATIKHVEHDSVYNHVITINVSERGSMMLDRLALAMMGC